eukprot:1342580-Amphidinium_carterae.1
MTSRHVFGTKAQHNGYTSAYPIVVVSLPCLWCAGGMVDKDKHVCQDSVQWRKGYTILHYARGSQMLAHCATHTSLASHAGLSVWIIGSTYTKAEKRFGWLDLHISAVDPRFCTEAVQSSMGFVPDSVGCSSEPTQACLAWCERIEDPCVVELVAVMATSLNQMDAEGLTPLDYAKRNALCCAPHSILYALLSLGCVVRASNTLASEPNRSKATKARRRSMTRSLAHTVVLLESLSKGQQMAEWMQDECVSLPSVIMFHHESPCCLAIITTSSSRATFAYWFELVARKCGGAGGVSNCLVWCAFCSNDVKSVITLCGFGVLSSLKLARAEEPKLEQAVKTTLCVGWDNLEWVHKDTAMHMAAREGSLEAMTEQGCTTV